MKTVLKYLWNEGFSPDFVLLLSSFCPTKYFLLFFRIELPSNEYLTKVESTDAGKPLAALISTWTVRSDPIILSFDEAGQIFTSKWPISRARKSKIGNRSFMIIFWFIVSSESTFMLEKKAQAAEENCCNSERIMLQARTVKRIELIRRFTCDVGFVPWELKHLLHFVFSKRII